MRRTRRYKDIERLSFKRLFAVLLVAAMLVGCSKEAKTPDPENGNFVDVHALREKNSDIFAWIYVKDTDINLPLCQSSDGDDYFYATHNADKEPATNACAYIEAANMQDMCDFNEVVHGVAPSELEKFLDKVYFDDHQFILVYMEGNVLAYYVIAAYTTEGTRLVEKYDFSYAYGCQQFIDDMYSQRSMTNIIRPGWEQGLSPEHFLLTMTAPSPSDPSKQILVVGCLVGDPAGQIDREIDWSNPEDE